MSKSIDGDTDDDGGERSHEGLDLVPLVHGTKKLAPRVI